LHSLNVHGEGSRKEIVMITHIIRAALALMAFTAIGFAQDFRATLSGLVTDRTDKLSPAR